MRSHLLLPAPDRLATRCRRAVSSAVNERGEKTLRSFYSVYLRRHGDSREAVSFCIWNTEERREKEQRHGPHLCARAYTHEPDGRIFPNQPATVRYIAGPLSFRSKCTGPLNWPAGLPRKKQQKQLKIFFSFFLVKRKQLGVKFLNGLSLEIVTPFIQQLKWSRMCPVVVVYSCTGAYVLIVSRLASGICLSEVGKKFEIQREEEGLSVRCCFVQVMPVLLLLLLLAWCCSVCKPVWSGPSPHVAGYSDETISRVVAVHTTMYIKSAYRKPLYKRGGGRQQQHNRKAIVAFFFFSVCVCRAVREPSSIFPPPSSSSSSVPFSSRFVRSFVLLSAPSSDATANRST